MNLILKKLPKREELIFVFQQKKLILFRSFIISLVGSVVFTYFTLPLFFGLFEKSMGDVSWYEIILFLQPLTSFVLYASTILFFLSLFKRLKTNDGLLSHMQIGFCVAFYFFIAIVGAIFISLLILSIATWTMPSIGINNGSSGLVLFLVGTFGVTSAYGFALGVVEGIQKEFNTNNILSGFETLVVTGGIIYVMNHINTLLQR